MIRLLYTGASRQIMVALLFFLAPVFATHVAVLETMSGKDVMTLEEKQYLTDVLRSEAVKALPAEQNYTIMTRENINMMLPPGKAIEDCEGTCLAETGKNIAADYISQARVGNFGGVLTLSVELYETASSKLISSFNGRGKDVHELLELIKEKSPELFQKVKTSGGSWGVGGIAAFGEKEGFNYVGKKKYIIEIVSKPSGAIPTIDGKALSKCLSTPCKVQVEEGDHRIVVSKDHYDDAETVVDVKSNNQKVELNLSPAFGWLEFNPKLEGAVAKKGELAITVNGRIVKKKKISIDPGIHDVSLKHPCYDPVTFKVVVAKNRVETFDDVLLRGKGAIELTAEYGGEPRAVPVYVDGVEMGSTPFAGEVPLCADIELRGKGWSEKVSATLKWHEVVQVTHGLTHAPEVVAMEEDPTRLRAKAAYDELDATWTDKAPEKKTNIPANTEQKPSQAKKIHWIPLGICALALVTGVTVALVENADAKKASEKTYSSAEEFKTYRQDAQDSQNARNAGLLVGALGALGLVLSFTF